MQTQIVTVTGYSSSGEGVARLDDGRVVFISGAARGDILEIMLTKEQARSANADIVQIVSPSQHRIEPECAFYPGCGGCDFQHLTYEEELDLKLQRVNDAFSRIGKSAARVGEIFCTGQTGGYRNKATFHSDGISLGYYRARSHDIIPIDRCLLLKDDLNNMLKSLVPGRGVTIRSGRNGLTPPLEEELDGLVYKVSGFFQVNTEAALLLFKKVREYAAMSKKETLLDMCCGVGSMTLFVGRDAGKAFGVEQDAIAVKTARENARRNNMPHVGFYRADIAQWKSNGLKPDCVIVDPPRNGLSREAVYKILELSPKRIVYVSCDPATLARDLGALKGYSVREACAIDMFPRTANVECCCLLFKD